MSYQDVFNEIQNQISSGLIQGAVVCSSLNETPIACGIQSGTVSMSADSRFDIASVGKVFTAACVALLSLEGRIDLDAPFTEYLPDHVLGNAGSQSVILPPMQAVLITVSPTVRRIMVSL